VAERTVADSDDASRALRRGLARLVLLLLLVVGVGALAYVVVQTYFEVEEVVLPDLSGMTLAQATTVLREADLLPLAFSENIAGVPVDTVTSQTPRPGALVRRGRTVGIGVNSPPESDLLPNLVGLDIEEALQRMRDAGLEVERVGYRYGEEPAGRVVAQNPVAGARLDAQPILLEVSRGLERANLQVPDLAGLTLDAARQRLQGLGFTRVESLASTVSFERPGSVSGQVPEAGTVVSAGTPIIVLYALGTNAVVQVPDVSGLPLWRAQVALRAAGLEVGSVSYLRDPTRPTGVVTLEPDALTVVGSPINVVINGEPGGPNILLGEPGDGTAPEAGDGTQPQTTASNSRNVPFSFDPRTLGIPALVGQAFDLRLVVSDDRGERTLLDRRVQADEVVTTSVSVFGDEPLLQTYINGDLYLAWRP
jgi:beta-lactam-binding protein with PASTA domain